MDAENNITSIKGTAKSGRSRLLIKGWAETPGSLLITQEMTIECVMKILKETGTNMPIENNIINLTDCDIEGVVEDIKSSETKHKIAFLDLSKNYTMDDYRKIVRLTGYVIVPCMQLPY